MSVLHLQTYVSDVLISLQAATSCCINILILAALADMHHAPHDALLGAHTGLRTSAACANIARMKIMRSNLAPVPS